MSANTLLLRLAGPIQSWGTGSRFQIRRTDAHPSKSGVLGLLLCAMGVSREQSGEALKELGPVLMGVRIDRPGDDGWDFHSAGAKIGIRSADGKIKKTESTGEKETLLSRRQYLWDASFLVALRGDSSVIDRCADALQNPTWPLFLGRKCCIPTEPVFAGAGVFTSLQGALTSKPWQPRLIEIDGEGSGGRQRLDTMIEHPAGTARPANAVLCHDVPRVYGYMMSYGGRWVVPGKIEVEVGYETQPPPPKLAWRDPYDPKTWPALRKAAMQRTRGLCARCKDKAVEVHHLDYDDARPETLFPLCRICHEACTMLEYSGNMTRRRIDPTSYATRDLLERQVLRLATEQRRGYRRRLMERTRNADFFDDLPAGWAGEAG